MFVEMFVQVGYATRAELIKESLDSAIILLPQRDRGKYEEALEMVNWVGHAKLLEQKHYTIYGAKYGLSQKYLRS
jgi:hypothetical protein